MERNGCTAVEGVGALRDPPSRTSHNAVQETVELPATECES